MARDEKVAKVRKILKKIAFTTSLVFMGVSPAAAQNTSPTPQTPDNNFTPNKEIKAAQIDSTASSTYDATKDFQSEIDIKGLEKALIRIEDEKNMQLVEDITKKIIANPQDSTFQLASFMIFERTTTIHNNYIRASQYPEFKVSIGLLKDRCTRLVNCVDDMLGNPEISKWFNFEESKASSYLAVRNMYAEETVNALSVPNSVSDYQQEFRKIHLSIDNEDRSKGRKYYEENRGILEGDVASIACESITNVKFPEYFKYIGLDKDIVDYLKAANGPHEVQIGLDPKTEIGEDKGKKIVGKAVNEALKECDEIVKEMYTKTGLDLNKNYSYDIICFFLTPSNDKYTQKGYEAKDIVIQENKAYQEEGPTRLVSREREEREKAFFTRMLDRYLLCKKTNISFNQDGDAAISSQMQNFLDEYAKNLAEHIKTGNPKLREYLSNLSAQYPPVGEYETAYGSQLTQIMINRRVNSLEGNNNNTAVGRFGVNLDYLNEFFGGGIYDKEGLNNYLWDLRESADEQASERYLAKNPNNINKGHELKILAIKAKLSGAPNLGKELPVDTRELGKQISRLGNGEQINHIVNPQNGVVSEQSGLATIGEHSGGKTSEVANSQDGNENTNTNLIAMVASNRLGGNSY